MDKLQKLHTTWKSLQPLSERKQYLLSQRFSVDYNFNSNHMEGYNISVAAVNKQLRQLTDKGYIQRTEADGSWKIFASSSI